MPRRGWLSDEDWRHVQGAVPIACADVLPVREIRGAIEVGLICRDTPHQGRRWVTIGGRILRNEPIRDAVARQVRETLGAKVECQVGLFPFEIVEYFSRRLKGQAFDPRQHAIGLTYIARLRGDLLAGGEAFAFRWFDRRALPAPRQIGFGQSKMLRESFERLERGVDPCGFRKF